MWNLLASELSSRVHEVSVSWVKGHAKQIDIERGRTTWEDKLGNDGADEMAVQGASTHKVPAEVVARAKARRRIARETHEMMVAILVERQIQEGLIKEDFPDRGSDDGFGCELVNSCMELIQQEEDEPEPLGCDGNDIDCPAIVHIVHKCINSLDDVSDAVG